MASCHLKGKGKETCMVAGPESEVRILLLEEDATRDDERFLSSGEEASIVSWHWCVSMGLGVIVPSHLQNGDGCLCQGVMMRIIMRKNEILKFFAYSRWGWRWRDEREWGIQHFYFFLNWGYIRSSWEQQQQRKSADVPREKHSRTLDPNRSEFESWLCCFLL